MKTYYLEVSGDYACFTRPEMKVERVSYDVITPSAARAIFEAILWKPAVRWHVRQVEVLKPIRWGGRGLKRTCSRISSDDRQASLILRGRQQREIDQHWQHCVALTIERSNNG
jgi:CRISPR-associated protein Cas5d